MAYVNAFEGLGSAGSIFTTRRHNRGKALKAMLNVKRRGHGDGS